ncbi:MAG: 23S rRNA (guanosine(2251)-2'-O)-methyltransferase RlmB [Ichthyobacteriaceae bacterium]|nr:23S rRNA (guanosine(2251)-2'-O)-methyltransferase RlmB [Ichthyobacteriaceae bacterium]
MAEKSNTESIFGIRPIIEGIRAGKTFDRIFIQKGISGTLITELKDLIKEHHIESKSVPVEKLNRLTKNVHQGVFAFISPVEFVTLENLVDETVQSDANPLFIILDQITDVRNFGAIVRTAECTGVNGIIIPKYGSAPVSADAMKTATGALFNVPICKVDHLKDAIYYMKSSGIQIIAATEKTEDSVYDTDLKTPTAIVMGNEQSGVAHGILKIVDKKAKLPLLGEISSLNVSVACGAVLYEAIRQRQDVK